ncbi:alpha/beta fold hydrolase [Alkalihalophilus marmarensis]|uniref:alpha/beta fold hydrolase n=1 Tax=Alkalihalophilus marmarensis TaxID=521377 RepID=UPI002DB74420|nr:alpha/beta fold hydrolase [Alkalihalophilus marmarensis]MEC2074256.1 hypothetical protein [Alkalihalophilus marmarensis]
MTLIQKYIASNDRYLCSVINNSDIDKDIVILVHGLAETKAEKEFIFTKISREVSESLAYTVVQFDLAGHGDSDGEIKQYNLNDWISDTINVIKSLDNFKNRKIHLIGTGIGNLIISCVANQLRSTEIKIYSQIFISPKNNFSKIKSFFEDTDSFDELKEELDTEIFLNMTYTNEQLSDSMMLFEPSPIFLNKGLHDCLIQLGSFSYDNIVTEIKKELIEDISEWSLLENNFDSDTKVLIIEGTENSWFNYNSEIHPNITVEKIIGDNYLLFNNPKRQIDIVEKILNFYNENRVFI